MANQMKENIQILYLLIFFTFPLLANTSEARFEIGGVKFDVSSPEGFHEIGSLFPDVWEMAEAVTPPTNKLLAVAALYGTMRWRVSSASRQ
jgi:hypothetical protein